MPAGAPSRRALWVGGACAVAVVAIWTAFIVIARFSARHALTPYDLAFLRFALSGAIALPFAVARRRVLVAGLGGAAAWRRGGALAATAGIGYCLLAYSGFFHAPAAHAAVLMPGSLPLWTALFATALAGERLTARRLVGLGCIVAGDLLVGGSSLLHAFAGGGTWKGDLLFLAAAMCWSLYGVLCRRWRIGAVDATLAIAIGCVVTFVPVYALCVVAGGVASGLGTAPLREIAVQALFQGGLSMLVAGIAFTQVVATFGPVVTTMLTAVVPGCAALLAVPLLGEPLGGAALGGLACVTTGLLLGLWRPRPPMPLAAALAEHPT